MRKWLPVGALAAVLVIGWLIDLSLGGGRAHTLGWLAALVLVVGPAAVIVRARAAYAPPVPPVAALDPEAGVAVSTEPVEVRPANADDIAHLPDVERRADAVFTVLGLGPFPPGSNTEESLSDALALFVVGDPPFGYARLDEVDAQAHLEQLSVVPKQMRKGHGSALVNAALDWAREHDYRAMTLCTFRDIPFNGPFYARLGFEPIDDLTPGLQSLREYERSIGLDAAGARVVMRCDLTRPSS